MTSTVARSHALENTIREPGQDRLGVATDQGGRGRILGKKARDGSLVFGVEAMDTAIAGKEVRNNRYMPVSVWLRRSATASCCLLW